MSNVYIISRDFDIQLKMIDVFFPLTVEPNRAATPRSPVPSAPYGDTRAGTEPGQTGPEDRGIKQHDILLPGTERAEAPRRCFHF